MAFHPRSAIAPLFLSAMGVLAALLMALAALSSPARAQEDHSGLTRESYRRNCLMCHNSVAPEGISPEIMAGLRPASGTRPRDAMPGLVCWRRCEACKLPEPKVQSASPGG